MWLAMMCKGSEAGMERRPMWLEHSTKTKMTQEEARELGRASEALSKFRTLCVRKPQKRNNKPRSPL
jgi:hypothetical protein